MGRAEEFFTLLNTGRNQGMAYRTPDFLRLLELYARDGAALRSLINDPVVITTRRKSIVPKTLGQKLYLQSIQKNPVVFGLGPGAYATSPGRSTTSQSPRLAGSRYGLPM